MSYQQFVASSCGRQAKSYAFIVMGKINFTSRFWRYIR